MHIDEYDRLRTRARGPLFAASEYLSLEGVQKEIALCDEGRMLLEKARKDIEQAIGSVSAVVRYVEQMHGFEP